MATRNLLVRAGFDASGMQRGVRQANGYLSSFGQNASRSMSGLSNIMGGAFGKIGKLLALKYAVTKVVQFGKECVELGSDLTEVQNVVDTTFGDMSCQVDEFASNSIKQLGMSETACKKYTSTMGAMLKSMGIETEPALKMSKTLTQLSADMASFYNLDAEDAFTKIRSGISGETEPLKQLGINMSVANLEAYALANGISKSYKKMSQSEQTLLRYNYLLSVTKDSQGDLSRTSHTWANQTRILNEQWKALKTNLGRGLINLLTPVVRWLNIILEKLQVVGEWFAKVTGYVFGDANESSGGNGIADTSIYDDAAAGLEGVGDAADEAGKKAKKAKDGIMSFDEINQLQKNDGSGSGGSGDVDDINNALGNLNNGTDNLRGKIPQLKKDTDSWLDKLLDLLEKIADRISDIIEKLLSIKPDLGFNWDTDKNKNIEINKTTKNIETFEFDFKAEEIVLEHCRELRNNIDQLLNGNGVINVTINAEKVLEKLTQIQQLINSIPSAKNISISFVCGELVQRLSAIRSLISSITTNKSLTINCNVNNVQVIIYEITSSLVALGQRADETNKGPLSRLWAFIKEQFSIDIVTAFKIIQTEGETVFKNVSSFMDTCKKTGDNVRGFFDSVWKGDISGAFECVKETGSDWKQHIINCFNNTKDECNQHTETMKTWVEEKWSSMSSLVIGKSDEIKTSVTKDSSDTKTSLDTTSSFISGTFSNRISTGCDSVSKKFSSMWDDIKTGCKNALNSVIDKINTATSRINSKLSFDLPDAFGGGHVGFSIPPIPRLARGGIVDRPTNFGNFIAGEENGGSKEMVVPLENTSFTDKIASAMGQAVMNAMGTMMNGSSNGGQNVSLEMDGTVFARSMAPYMIREMKRLGFEL